MINKAHWIAVPLIAGFMLIPSGIIFAKQTSYHTNRPKQIRRVNTRIKSAVSMLANRDSDGARVTYYRHGHILSFSVNNYNLKEKFRGEGLTRQMSFFKHHTGLTNITPRVNMTKQAILHHQTQLREQKKQREENHRRAKALIKQAQQEARAKQKAEAKRKAEQKAKKQKEQARQRKLKEQEAKQKRAKQNEAKRQRADRQRHQKDNK